MNTLWYLLPALACPLGIAAILWLMLRPQCRRPADGAAELHEFAALRSQLAASHPSRRDTGATTVGADR